MPWLDAEDLPDDQDQQQPLDLYEEDPLESSQEISRRQERSLSSVGRDSIMEHASSGFADASLDGYLDKEAEDPSILPPYSEKDRHSDATSILNVPDVIHEVILFDHHEEGDLRPSQDNPEKRPRRNLTPDFEESIKELEDGGMLQGDTIWNALVAVEQRLQSGEPPSASFDFVHPVWLQLDKAEGSPPRQRFCIRRAEPVSKLLLLVPIYHEGSPFGHWTLASIDWHRKTVRHHDSIPSLPRYYKVCKRLGTVLQRSIPSSEERFTFTMAVSCTITTQYRQKRADRQCRRALDSVTALAVAYSSCMWLTPSSLGERSLPSRISTRVPKGNGSRT